jgi:predicted metal-dependent hydrolase
MPLDFCHPQAPHKKLKIPEWYVSSLMLDRALDAIVRRVKKLDRAHDIPYLAGYSRDGKIIYIDRHMPRAMKYRGREIDTDRFLILHEEVEKTLIDQLDLHYLHAHQIATRAEEAAVRAAGILWRDYDRFMQKNVKKIGDERLTKVPPDLDLKPYRDEHDFELLKRMLHNLDKGRVPPGIDEKKIRNAIARHQAELREHLKEMAKSKR